MAMTRSAEVEADLSKVKAGLEKVEAGLEKVEAEIAKLKEFLKMKFECSIEELQLKWGSKEETNPVIEAQLARLDKLQNEKLLLQNEKLHLHISSLPSSQAFRSSTKIVLWFSPAAAAVERRSFSFSMSSSFSFCRREDG